MMKHACLALVIQFCIVLAYRQVTWREHQYLFSDQWMPFAEAQDFCSNYGGLISILNQDENELVYNESERNGYWIGLTTDETDCSACSNSDTTPDCFVCRRNWYWIDQSPVTYSNWFNREPSGGSNCVRIEGRGWLDAPSCTTHYYQPLCKRHLCDFTYCGAHGSCRVANNNAVCDCDMGYTGIPCEEINDCIGVECNNGLCIDGVQQYWCDCHPGYTGSHCETEVNLCAPNPCQSGGTCASGILEFRCFCASGYTGALCQTDIDDCEGINCNNGTCTDSIANFTCDCNRGYAGLYCDTEIKMDEDVKPEDEKDLNGLWIALYVGIIGCTMSVIALLYCVFTDHAVKQKLQKLLHPKNQELVEPDSPDEPTPSTSF